MPERWRLWHFRDRHVFELLKLLWRREEHHQHQRMYQCQRRVNSPEQPADRVEELFSSGGLLGAEVLIGAEKDVSTSRAVGASSFISTTMPKVGLVGMAHTSFRGTASRSLAPTDGAKGCKSARIGSLDCWLALVLEVLKVGPAIMFPF